MNLHGITCEEVQSTYPSALRGVLEMLHRLLRRRLSPSAPPPAGLPPLIPRSVLFGNPERVSPRLSPDGTRIAFLAPLDGVMNVYVRSVGAEDARPVTHE